MRDRLQYARSGWDQGDGGIRVTLQIGPGVGVEEQPVVAPAGPGCPIPGSGPVAPHGSCPNQSRPTHGTDRLAEGVREDTAIRCGVESARDRDRLGVIADLADRDPSHEGRRDDGEREGRESIRYPLESVVS
jgi:hypothetical protein